MSYSLSFSKAVLVVIFISDKIQQGMYDYLSTKMISEVLDIPKPTLVKILTELNRAGIIESKEGKSGGVRLIPKPSNITVLDIFNAIEFGKPLFQTEFHITAKGKRPDNALTALGLLFTDAEEKMKITLANTTIEDIIKGM